MNYLCWNGSLKYYMGIFCRYVDGVGLLREGILYLFWFWYWCIYEGECEFMSLWFISVYNYYFRIENWIVYV